MFSNLHPQLTTSVSHGGLIASLLTRTATDYAARKMANPRFIPASSQFHFHSPTLYGEVSIEVQEIKLGKRFGILRARLLQQADQTKPAQLKLEATVTVEDPATWKANASTNLPTTTASHYKEIWNRSEGVRIPAKAIGAPFYKFKPRMVFTFRPGSQLEFGGGQVAPDLGPSVIEAWHRGDENWTVHHLPFVADHIGPVLHNYEKGRQLRQMTQSMSVDVVREPPIEGWEWLFLRHEMVTCENGRLWVDVIILDENKDIVAIARHQCAARPLEKYHGKSSKL